MILCHDVLRDYVTARQVYACYKVDLNAKAKPEIEIAKENQEENPRREKNNTLREEEALASEMRNLQETLVWRPEGKGFGYCEAPENQETPRQAIRGQFMLNLHAQGDEKETL